MGTGSPSRDLIMRAQRAPVCEWAQHCSESAHRLPYAGGRWGRTTTPDDDDDGLRAAAVAAAAAAALLCFTFLPPFAPVPHSSLRVSVLTRFNAPGIDLGVRAIVC